MATKKIKSTCVGNLKLESIRNNEFLADQERTIRVLLPDNYDPNGEPYEVYYMLDGQNLFDAATASYNMEWCIDETIKRLEKEKGIRAPIVVGLDCGQDRINEYMPKFVTDEFYKENLKLKTYRSKEEYPEFENWHKGDITFRFLFDQVIPLIEEKYNVRKDADGRTFGGSSMGGLMGLYAYEHYTDQFKNFICFSIAFNVFKKFFESDVVFDNFLPTYQVHKDKKIAICVGNVGYEKDFVRYYNEINQKSRDLGLDDTNIIAIYNKDAMHNEIQWANVFYPVYQFFNKK